MPLSLQFEFTYLYDPTIPFRARAAATGLSQLASAQVDTGADRTVIDIDIALAIGLSPQSGRTLL